MLLRGMERSQENGAADREKVVLTLTFINLCAVDHSGCHHLIRFTIAEHTLQLVAKASVGEGGGENTQHHMLLHVASG